MKNSKAAFERVGWGQLYVRLMNAGWFGKTFEEVFRSNFEQAVNFISIENGQQ